VRLPVWLAIGVVATLCLVVAGGPVAANAASTGGLVAAEAGAGAERLLAARQAAGQIGSYRMRGAADSAKQGRVAILAEYVAPDRAHLLMHVEPDPATPPARVDSLEVIVIGATSYLNFGAGWTTIEGDSGAAAQTSQFDLRRLLDAIDPASVALEGSETVDGEPCNILVSVRDGERLALWMSIGDALVRQIKADSLDTKLSLAVVDLNAPIEINPPL
jgi:hypothetical protein